MSTIVAADAAGLERAAERLRNGGLVAFPTETVYGLGADARDPEAVRRIFEAKGRPSDHPVIVHLRGSEELSDWLAPVPEGALRLAEAFWPGPLTIVGRAAPEVPDAVTGGQPTVAVRCPSHPVAAALLARVGGPLAAPSANRFGRLSPTLAHHVAGEFADQELLILDGGASEVGLESTIVDLSGDGPRLLRPGRIGPRDLEDVLAVPIDVAGSGADAPRAPGRLASHYAPGAALRLAPAGAFPGTVGPGDAALLRTAPEPRDGSRWLRLPADPDGYGRSLYAALRTLDEGRPRTIVVETPPDGDAWRAIHDRLARAAAPRGDRPTSKHARSEGEDET